MREFKDAITGHSPDADGTSAESQPQLPSAEPTATETTAAPAERETV